MRCDAHPPEQLTPEELVAYLDGELSEADAQRVAAHLDVCTACAREAHVLGLAGELVAGLPRHEPGAEFADRVQAAVAGTAQPQGRQTHTSQTHTSRLIRTYWPAAAAAAVLVAAIAARGLLGGGDATEGVLTAAEAREIASDLYVLTNLDTLESVDADELIALVEELDRLEGLEPERSGLSAAEADDGEGG
jgi:anti-sigma factor RsiW